MYIYIVYKMIKYHDYRYVHKRVLNSKLLDVCDFLSNAHEKVSSVI